MMTLGWDFETTGTTVATTASLRKADIHNELKNVVIGFFRDSLDYYKLNMVGKYQLVYETVTFLFEDYRRDFERLIQEEFNEKLSEEQKHVEAIVYCSWITLEVMSVLST